MRAFWQTSVCTATLTKTCYSILKCKMLPTCLMCFDNENQRGLSCKFYFHESYMIVYICLNVQQINCSKRKMFDFSLHSLLHLRCIQITSLIGHIAEKVRQKFLYFSLLFNYLHCPVFCANKVDRRWHRSKH